MATNNHTEYNATEMKIQRQVDALASALWSCTISPEALEQKLATRHFSDAEKTCIRYALRATKVEDCDVGEALESEWGEIYDDEISVAVNAELAKAETTGDFRRVTRLHELSGVVDSCIEAAIAGALH